MLAFSNDYYGFIFRATQSVELFCAYNDLTMLVHKTTAFLLELVNQHLKAANESLDYIYVCDDINEITKCMLNAFPCIKKV